MPDRLTPEMLIGCHMQTLYHADGSQFFVWAHRCVEYPRLSRIVTTQRRSGERDEVWCVDDQPIGTRLKAIAAFNGDPIPEEPKPVPEKIHIDAQIAEVRREIALRQSVHPEQVRRGKMKQSQADLHMAQIHAVLNTLEWIKLHEAEIREDVRNARSGRAEAGAA